MIRHAMQPSRVCLFPGVSLRKAVEGSHGAVKVPVGGQSSGRPSTLANASRVLLGVDFASPVSPHRVGTPLCAASHSMMASTTMQAVFFARGGTAKRATPVCVAPAARGASSVSRAACRLSSKSSLGGLEAGALTASLRPVLARGASRVAHAAVAAGKKVLIVNTPAGAHGACSHSRARGRRYSPGLNWWDPLLDSSPGLLPGQAAAVCRPPRHHHDRCASPPAPEQRGAQCEGCLATSPLTPRQTACAADSDKLKKPPYAYWGELTSAGCSAVFGDAVSPSLFPAGATFDVVVDNNGAP